MSQSIKNYGTVLNKAISTIPSRYHIISGRPDKEHKWQVRYTSAALVLRF